ncbi:hypothetical protein FRC08_004277 [Ceratobasidium sp. 394]|nr:hypothetical protein FRC08_004277 [Ceratobasidium sp. 394]
MFIPSSFERQVRAFDTASKLKNRDLRFQERSRGLDPYVTRCIEYFQRNDTTVAHTCEIVDEEFSLGPQIAEFGGAQSDMVEISTTSFKKSPGTALAQASPEARQK